MWAAWAGWCMAARWRQCQAGEIGQSWRLLSWGQPWAWVISWSGPIRDQYLDTWSLSANQRPGLSAGLTRTWAISEPGGKSRLRDCHQSRPLLWSPVSSVSSASTISPIEAVSRTTKRFILCYVLNIMKVRMSRWCFQNPATIWNPVDDGMAVYRYDFSWGCRFEGGMWVIIVEGHWRGPNIPSNWFNRNTDNKVGRSVPVCPGPVHKSTPLDWGQRV